MAKGRTGKGAVWSATKKVVMHAFPPIRRLVRQRDELRQRNRQLRSENSDLKRRHSDCRHTVKSLRSTLRAARSQEELYRREIIAEPTNGYLFIVTYGRSGSTLLQGILSSIPGYLIRGENGGATYHLYKFHSAVATRRDAKHGSTSSPQNPWFGIGGYLDPVAFNALRRLLLTTLLRPEEDTKVVGFKEIRWLQTDLLDYVHFLRAVFPKARFIINTRNLDDVATSKWWATQPNARDNLDRAEQRMLVLLGELGDDAFHIHYDDYVANVARLRPLFEWLGEEFNASLIQEVMARKHSY